MVSTVILNVADYDEEDEDEESVPAVEPPRVSHHAPRVRTSNSAVITPIESQNRRRRGLALEMLLDMRSRQSMFNFELQMSLMSPFEMQGMLLPSGTSGVKDLYISPSHSSLALFASLGKKLSVLSPSLGIFTFTRIVFQVPAWSCSWDLNNSHYIYAGLQNGCVLVFDMCQTAGPMKSLVGLTRNPVHTVHSLSQTSSLSSGVKTILSASAIDLCQWNIDSEER
ncbi:hypothetical protein JHK82_054016 [Glycine max]|uniref:RING-type E3 ubiquitin transferase n=1 Tax=Glycine soja TaxID=3848 RepID=A0A445FIC6_GLYSO|nr:hypothetical protein JHK86_053863 [Glycine max]KHN02310.1 E3 ubiquitin-protein ligase RFWD3 [Glycine soja]KAG4928331.1 hypothetical protein JHK85_054817 [Glycine max]KAG5083852.1 hypothetical protein JHK84_053890 [Glycine max]KAG5086619.1 hypothetical protein JHK82_054016 [Glycine max]